MDTIFVAADVTDVVGVVCAVDCKVPFEQKPQYVRQLAAVVIFLQIPQNESSNLQSTPTASLHGSGVVVSTVAVEMDEELLEMVEDCV